MTQFEDDLVLQREDVVDPAVDLDRPADLAGRDLDEARRDPHHAAKALIATNDDPCRSETPANVDRQRVVQVRIGAEVTQRVIDPRTADDGQAVDVLEIGTDGFGYPGSNPVVGRLAGDVRKRHHRNRVINRARRRHGGDAARQTDRHSVQLAGHFAQVVRDIACLLVPKHRILLQRTGHYGIEACGHAARVPRGRRRHLVQDPIDDFGRRRTLERHTSGQQLEQNHAEREQIDAVIDRSPKRLLWSHIRDRPDDHSRHRHLRRGHFLRCHVRNEFGEAEVEDLDEAALGAHQVCALDVAMDDPARMRLLQGIGHLDADLDDLAHRHGTTRDARGEELTVDVLHHDEVRTVLFADVVGDRDVGRTQHRGRPRFVQKTRSALRVGFERRRQEFERNRAPKSRVFTTIHFAHAAGAQAFVHAIMLDSRAYH